MTYKEYPYIDKTYVLHHTEGIGVMESPLYEREIIATSDNKEELEELGRKTYPRDGSGWDYHKWCININTSSKGGKVLLDKFHEKCDQIQAKIEANPDNYITTETSDGQKWTVEKNEALDGQKSSLKSPLSSCQFMIFDVSKPDNDDDTK